MNDPKYIGCFVRDNNKVFSSIEAGVAIDKVWEHGQFSANSLGQDVKLYIGGEYVKTFKPKGDLPPGQPGFSETPNECGGNQTDSYGKK